jgi:thiol:disulfide interchange protein DsbD
MSKVTLLILAALSFAAVIVAPGLLSSGGTGGGVDSASALQSGHFVSAAGLVFLGGIVTSLTPCVFPLIPITVAIFSGGNAKSRSRSKATLLTFVYVLGMATTFVILGTGAALSGKVFGSVLSSPIVSVVLAAFFVALAFSMFGAYDLALPSGLAQRLNTIGGAGFGGSFSMGLVAGLVAAPCTGPVLASILAYVAVHQSVQLGAVLMFIYALGIGVPFLLIGALSFTFGRKGGPKSGPWMDAVKSLVGIVLLAMALAYLRNAFPGVGVHLPDGGGPVLVYVLAGFVAIGVLVGAVHKSFHGPTREKVLKGMGLALILFGLTARLDVENVAMAASETAKGEGIPWVHQLEPGLAQAKASHKPVFIDFYADWCAACKELDRKTYPDAKVRAEAKRFVPIKIDGTRSSDELDKIYETYGVEGLPTVIFIDSDGKVLKDPRLVGFVSPGDMVEILKKVQ